MVDRQTDRHIPVTEGERPCIESEREQRESGPGTRERLEVGELLWERK